MSTPEQIWPDQHLADGVPGWEVRVVASTGSTNTDLLAAAVDGAPDHVAMVAAHQLEGRGRLDRRWEAPPGANLLVSVLIREVPDPPVEVVSRVVLAAREACTIVAGVTPSLKWPNDLLVEDRKLAGILSQRAPDGAVVAGLGLNVGWAPEGAVSLAGLTRRDRSQVTPMRVLRELLMAYDRLPAHIGELYRGALATLGRRVRVELPDDAVLEGTAVDVDAAGRLVVVDTCGSSHHLDVGDIVHLRAR